MIATLFLTSEANIFIALNTKRKEGFTMFFANIEFILVYDHIMIQVIFSFA